MDKVLYVAMTGAKHNMRAQVAHTNNLANASTSGFKADLAQARSMPVYYGDGLPTRSFALTENPGTDFSGGPLIQTDRDLDLAIKGDGFFAVQTPDGLEGYTRGSSLYVDSVGILRTGNNLPVLGAGGPIAIPPAEKIEIGEDGTISIIPLGEDAAQIAVVDQIKLVNPNLDDLEKSENGLIQLKEGQEPLPIDANVRVISGFVEGSNVNAIGEMTAIIGLARQFEMQVKIMETAQQNSETSARLLQSQ